MKKIFAIVLLCAALTGCAATETFETLGNVEHERSEQAAAGKLTLSLPSSASKEAFSNGGDTMYDCDGYTLMLQTLSSGDLTRTVRAISGFSPDKLTLMESRADGYGRYEWVWTAAGEGTDVICRAAVLDDGNYHYCLYTIAAAQDAGTLTQEWNAVFSSFRLADSIA